MTNAGYWVAAEGKQRLPGGGIAGGTGSVTPAGLLHAVDPESERVLCGEPIRMLVAFRHMSWTGMSTGVRCRDCLRTSLAAAP